MILKSIKCFVLLTAITSLFSMGCETTDDGNNRDISLDGANAFFLNGYWRSDDTTYLITESFILRRRQLGYLTDRNFVLSIDPKNNSYTLKNGNKYFRIDWHYNSKSQDELWFCRTQYMDTVEDVVKLPAPDPSDLAGGCISSDNQNKEVRGPWEKLTRDISIAGLWKKPNSIDPFEISFKSFGNNVVKHYSNQTQRMIYQTDTGYNRFAWEFNGDTLHGCIEVSNAVSFDAANLAPNHSDPSKISTGCNGQSWQRYEKVFPLASKFSDWQEAVDAKTAVPLDISQTEFQGNRIVFIDNRYQFIIYKNKGAANTYSLLFYSIFNWRRGVLCVATPDLGSPSILHGGRIVGFGSQKCQSQAVFGKGDGDWRPIVSKKFHQFEPAGDWEYPDPGYTVNFSDYWKGHDISWFDEDKDFLVYTDIDFNRNKNIYERFYLRVDYSKPDGEDSLYICPSEVRYEELSEAIAAGKPDVADLDAGCYSKPWTKLMPSIEYAGMYLKKKVSGVADVFQILHLSKYNIYDGEFNEGSGRLVYDKSDVTSFDITSRTVKIDGKNVRIRTYNFTVNGGITYKFDRPVSDFMALPITIVDNVGVEKTLNFDVETRLLGRWFAPSTGDEVAGNYSHWGDRRFEFMLQSKPNSHSVISDTSYLGVSRVDSNGTKIYSAMFVKHIKSPSYQDWNAGYNLVCELDLPKAVDKGGFAVPYFLSRVNSSDPQTGCDGKPWTKYYRLSRGW